MLQKLCSKRFSAVKPEITVVNAVIPHRKVVSRHTVKEAVKALQGMGMTLFTAKEGDVPVSVHINEMVGKFHYRRIVIHQDIIKHVRFFINNDNGTVKRILDTGKKPVLETGSENSIKHYNESVETVILYKGIN